METKEKRENFTFLELVSGINYLRLHNTIGLICARSVFKLCNSLFCDSISSIKLCYCNYMSALKLYLKATRRGRNMLNYLEM